MTKHSRFFTVEKVLLHTRRSSFPSPSSLPPSSPPVSVSRALHCIHLQVRGIPRTKRYAFRDLGTPKTIKNLPTFLKFSRTFFFFVIPSQSYFLQFMSLKFSYGSPSYVEFGLDLKNVGNSWTEPNGSEFLVRGKGYLQQKGKNVKSLKVPSRESPYECIGLNIFRSKTRLEHSSSKIAEFQQFLEKHSEEINDEGLPKFLIICWMFSNFSGKEHTLVQHVFHRNGSAAGEDPILERAFQRFLNADEKGKNEVFKYLFRVVEGPQAMTTVVDKLGGERPVLIGKKLTTKYFRGANYLEIDMDVGSSLIATMLNKVSTQLVRYLVAQF